MQPLSVCSQQARKASQKSCSRPRGVLLTRVPEQALSCLPSFQTSSLCRDFPQLLILHGKHFPLSYPSHVCEVLAFHQIQWKAFLDKKARFFLREEIESGFGIGD
uniref:A630005I04Rik protein n=1 Tax=Mus musculus TaxID=10090 RepID=B9EKL4_MOUSE|nr:A630005I04Rik protein [Mus musculus]